MNTCLFMGTITKNGIKTSTYGDNKTRVNFSISIYDGKDANGNSKTTYVPFVAFGKSAEMIAKYFTSGSPTSITAKFGTYEMTGDNGEKKYGYNFTVDNINFLPKDFSQSNNNSVNNPGTTGGAFGGQANGTDGGAFGSTYKVDKNDSPFGV